MCGFLSVPWMEGRREGLPTCLLEKRRPWRYKSVRRCTAQIIQLTTEKTELKGFK